MSKFALGSAYHARFLTDVTGLFFFFVSFPFCPFPPKSFSQLVIKEALLTVRQGGKGAADTTPLVPTRRVE